MIDNFAHRAADWDNPSKVEMTEKFVKEMMLQITPHPEWKALEVGAGTGLVGIQVLPFVRKVVFEDTSEAMLAVLKDKVGDNFAVEVLHGEVYDYNKQDIDFVFSCMAFHHIPDIEKTIHHLAKITNPNAIVVVGDLITEDGSFHSFEPIPHCGFDLTQLSHRFKEAGFEVLSAHCYNILKRERVEGNPQDYEQFIIVAKKN